ncbi:RNA polymerase sigma factor [Streptomyces netropsis]|uniref:RNA polymerase sigma factor (Sigma-70 family) n=1 Tax=Streptomyces netropsis TaxID=55404 RepID=A0A7W7LJS2_STRNE|nr:sigma-70 family RNA polymerase sigma factor [Streptomyces netropsis]MBB4890906.1 RNA polymerase sigma factor (sigma-70 family) [Streptomyces netropsis]
MDSFTRFYDEWFPRGVGFAMRLGLDREDAKEAASDAMRAVYAAWGSLETPEAFYQHVVRRRVIDTLRDVIPRERAEVSVSDTDADDDEALPREVIAVFTSHVTPEGLYLEAEGAERILAILAQLPEHYRLSLVLAAQGYDTTERAEIKTVSAEVERTHLKRARRRCIDLLISHGIRPRRTTDKPTNAKEGEAQ